MTHQDRRWLSAPRVCARYGISDMSLWRWLHDKDLQFPQPIYVAKRRYFDEDELDAFDRRQVLKSIRAQPPRQTRLLADTQREPVGKREEKPDLVVDYEPVAEPGGGHG
jgi:predicted DNA-binding transcriptional regulator AlpA